MIFNEYKDFLVVYTDVVLSLDVSRFLFLAMFFLLLSNGKYVSSIFTIALADTVCELRSKVDRLNL